MTDKCYAKCVTRPGAKLDDSEKVRWPRRCVCRALPSPTAPFQVCLAKCMDRYLDAMALVSQTWAARAKQQAMSQQGGFGASGFQ